MEHEKLGSVPIPTLLLKTSVPMMFSFLIQALYNIVDSMFVSHISEYAFTAVSLAFPMQALSSAFAVGIAIGMSALLPRRLGQNDQQGAEEVAHVSLTMQLICSVLFLVLAFVFVPSFYHIQTTIPSILHYGIPYLQICWIFVWSEFLGQYFQKMLIASSQSMDAMIAQTFGAIFNLIMDPILIFGLGWGVTGAAIATVAGQCVAAYIAYRMNRRVNGWLRFDRKKLGIKINIVHEILEVGLPSMITIGLASLTTFIMNIILLSVSVSATALFGIWMKIQNFCFMPMYGLNNSMIPILSYNDALGRKDRVQETISYALRLASILLILCTIVIEVAPGFLLSLFKASSTGIPTLRVCAISLWFGGISLIFASSLQALHCAKQSMMIHLLRQFIVLLPMFLLFSSLFTNITYIFSAICFTEIFTFLVAYRFQAQRKNGWC